MKAHAAVWLTLALAPVASFAQEPPAQPVAAIHLGAGNHYGWLGGGAEIYPVRGRLSLFAGAGIAPQGPTVATAGGVRYYAPLDATPHRFFGDLSVSLMRIAKPTGVGGPLTREYGVGLCFGYSHLAQSGRTLTAGAGVGASELGGDFEFLPVVQIAVGWTWRR